MRRTIVAVWSLGFAACDGKPPPKPAEPPAPEGRTAHVTPAPVKPQTAAPAPKVDCEGLVGQADASRVIGTPLVLVDQGKVGPRRCRFGVSADDPKGAQLDVVYACGPAALPMFRNIEQEIGRGGAAVQVGKKAVLLRKEDRGIVQFLDEDSPCAAEVVAVPADKAVEAARLVAGKLKGPVM